MRCCNVGKRMRLMLDQTLKVQRNSYRHLENAEKKQSNQKLEYVLGADMNVMLKDHFININEKNLRFFGAQNLCALEYLHGLYYDSERLL